MSQMGYFWNIKEVLHILVHVNEDLRKTHRLAKKEGGKEKVKIIFFIYYQGV